MNFILLFILLQVSFLRISPSSQLFYGDFIFIPICLLVLIISGKSFSMSAVPRFLILVAVFPVVALYLDLWNAIGLDDLKRGVGRNTVFSVCLICGVIFKNILGLTGWLKFAISILIARSLAVIFENPVILDNIEHYLKFGGGWAIISVLIIMLSGISIKTGILAAGVGVVFCYYYSFRGMAMICLSALICDIIIMLRKNGLVFSRYKMFYAIFISILVIFGGMLILKGREFFDLGFLSDQKLEAQSGSERQRLDLAIDAWFQFLQHPFTGIGTWQHSNQYIDILNIMELVGVHSVVIMLACEYGLFGLLFALAILGLNLYALYSITFHDNKLNLVCFNGLKWSFVIVIYNFVFSPFNGPDRILWGYLASGAVIFMFHQHSAADNRKNALEKNRDV